MAPVDFHLTSSWRVRGSIGDTYDVISEPQNFVRWWPEVYLRVEEIEAGDANGVGKTVDLHTRGILPYTLDWQATETEKPPA